MIYITGDTHGQLSRITTHSWTKGDKLIVTGDFGFVLFGEDKCPEERLKLNRLASLPCEILFIDGNHEGFPQLETYPLEERYGAPVRRLRPNIFWLQRAQIYTIEGNTFFTMGGAASPDKTFRELYRAISGDTIWFPQELPAAQDYPAAWQVLYAHQRQVDYILTHTAPFSVIPQLTHSVLYTEDTVLTRFLDEVFLEITFRCWYCGHFHTDRALEPLGGKPLICCYAQILPLAEP